MGFGHLSVTLSNAGHAKKCVGNYCTLLALTPMDCALRGCFRPIEVGRAGGLKIIMLVKRRFKRRSSRVNVFNVV